MQKFKAEPSHDYDTEYVDVDRLLHLYVEQFKLARELQRPKYTRLLMRILSEKQPDFTLDRFQFATKDFCMKAETPFLSHPAGLSYARVLLHSYMSGNNSY
jgi:hypothetical protein